MENLTIKEIANKLENINDIDDPFLNKLATDHRKGVNKLYDRHLKMLEKTNNLKKKFREMSKYETDLFNAGFTNIAGIDEAGRGPLAGPVVAAAVILGEDFQLLGLDDSKALSNSKREAYYQYIIKHAKAVAVGIVEPAEIDKINIYEATKVAMLRAVNQLQLKPNYLLIDAMELSTNINYQSIIQGDAKSISIAAASIVAKVTRDRHMIKIGNQYPQYKFANNKGYGTAEHLAAIEKFGITEHHRQTFAPLNKL